jgi:hypothetical protein
MVWVGQDARLGDYLAATHMLKAQGTWSEEESVPRHGQKRRERF